ncbi:MAG TPA: hypothetical protein VHS05_02250 [Pyrinomonadaceae bacterium]|jgi:hypothetical protein|nr:hypothetical protein [Pyrinomonadaceae bacterium]
MKRAGVVLCLVFSASLTYAQAPAKSVAPGSTTPTETEELKERRARARSLLVSLASDARTFHDQTLRARSLARIADALWKVDAEQGRLMFRKAWEAAEVADQESENKLQEEINQQKARSGGSFATNTPPSIRREVLRLAARHDRTISEEFLEKLKQQKLETANSATTKPSPTRLGDALSQRLDVARELMRMGELERALQFADPALSLVTMETMNFLCDVREKNPAAADARYSALLASSASNPQADANTVSLLSSYIFTPHLFMTFSNNGSSSSQSSSKIVPADVSPDLRNAFFQSAASILLRPLPVPGQTDQTSAGLDGKFLVIKRLLPFYEQSAPAAMVESLRGHLNALQTMVSDNARHFDEDQLNRGTKPERTTTDQEQSLLDRIDRAKTSEERDSLYLQLAFTAYGKGDMRARDFVSKVEDSEVRKQAQAYIDTSLTIFFVGKKQTDQALELVHKGEISQLVKAWALAECAKVLFKTDRDKALDLIDEAVAEARRIDVSDPGLPRALVAVANALNATDRERVWDATFDAVKAANSAEGFTGEDGEVVAKFQSKGQSSVHTNDVPEFDLDGLFRDLATQDYDRAVELARGFQAEGPRAVATIAIARAILEPKPQKGTKNTK